MIEVQQERQRVPAVPRRLGPGIALGAAAGPAVFTLTWLVLGFVSRGYTAWGVYVPYSPIHQGVSGLGLGETAPYMNAAFIVNGLLTLAGIAAIFAGIPELGRTARRVCIAMLALPAIGSIVDGIFTLESFWLHNLGFALVLSTAAGFPVVGFVLRRLPAWRQLGTALIAVLHELHAHGRRRHHRHRRHHRAPSDPRNPGLVRRPRLDIHKESQPMTNVRAGGRRGSSDRICPGDG